MKDDLNYLQTQIMEDITYSESIISASRQLADFLNLGPGFYDELELTSSTLQELIQRISQALNLNSFLLATKQVRLMAIDLLNICKEKMIKI